MNETGVELGTRRAVTIEVHLVDTRTATARVKVQPQSVQLNTFANPAVRAAPSDAGVVVLQCFCCRRDRALTCSWTGGRVTFSPPNSGPARHGGEGHGGETWFRWLPRRDS